MKKNIVKQSDIEQGMAELGMTSGYRIMVHSSLSSFGHVEGGASAVISALKNVVGFAGTVLMPSFNHGSPFADDGAGYYDPATTPTTNGAIPDLFWRQPETFRSLNPTHPFAAWGKDAEEIVCSHHLGTTMGQYSPLNSLWLKGGHVLLLGVDFRANTFHHMVESVTGAPCLGRRTEEYPVRCTDGQIMPMRTWGWRERSCPITDENRYGSMLIETGVAKQVTIGMATCTCVPMAECYSVIAEVLQSGIPPYPPCSECPIRPRKTSWTVA